MLQHHHQLTLRSFMPALVVAMFALAALGTNAETRQEMKIALQKSNGSGIVLGFTEPFAARPRAPASLTMKFDGVTDPAGGQVQLAPDVGLTLSGEAAFKLVAGQSDQRSVTLTANAEGLFYLNVFTTQWGRTSVASIPVKIGHAVPALKSLGKLTDSGQEKLVVMPVP